MRTSFARRAIRALGGPFSGTRVHNVHMGYGLKGIGVLLRFCTMYRGLGIISGLYSRRCTCLYLAGYRAGYWRRNLQKKDNEKDTVYIGVVYGYLAGCLYTRNEGM